jgi:membrane-bound serine protease (ClpP class)
MTPGRWPCRTSLAAAALALALGAGLGQSEPIGAVGPQAAGPAAEMVAQAAGPAAERTPERAAAQAPGSARPTPVLVGAIEGAIGPATVRHVERLVTRAAESQAGALVLRLNTPGGLTDSTREVIAAILGSPVPVIGWVAPPGAHAASAGTYILYATHLAAMAPGTNLGAATPVQLGGAPGVPNPGLPEPTGPDEGAGNDKDDGNAAPARAPLSGADAMAHKVTNDAVAFIRSLAELRGRNAGWAERAVREAASLSAEAAAGEGVIEIVAGDLGTLLAKADGRSVEVLGEQRVLRTDPALVETVEPGAVTRLLAVLSNPNVALVLMMIGVYGLILEFMTPGVVAPGVIGAICLTLGLYSLNQLPLDYAGLALIGFGIAFLVAEAFSPSYGVLGFGGLVAFVLGSAMLIDTDVPEYQISWWLIGAMAAASGAVLILLVGFSWRAYRRAPASTNPMLGLPAEVLDWSRGAGHVRTAGERWNAVGPPDLVPGETVRVEVVDGLTLSVARAAMPEATTTARRERWS